MKIPKKPINQKDFHNFQLHLACWHTKMFTLIRYTICESLMKIQQFRHEWSSKMYENTQKMQWNQRDFHNLQSHLAFLCIKICVLSRYTFCVILEKICAAKRKCHSHLWFSDIGLCFRPAQTKSLKNQKIC